MSRRTRTKKREVVLLNCSGSGSFGGAATLEKYLGMGLEEHDWSVRSANHKNIGNPDVVIMVSIGAHGEKNKEQNQRRITAIQDKMETIPFVLIRNGVTEPRVFKHSWEGFLGHRWDGILSVEDDPGHMMEQIRQTMRYKKLAYMPHPFSFSPMVVTRRGFENRIAQTARMAGCKNTELALQIADKIHPHKEVYFWGKEQGVYWYHAVRESKYREHSIFKGEYKNYLEVYNDVAFGMDLSYIHSGKFIAGNRTQYTVLEAVDQGVIPIGFECWRSEYGYGGVWLPNPVKQGNKVVYDVDECVERILQAPYSWKIARENFHILSSIHDFRIVGEKVSDLLGEII